MEMGEEPRNQVAADNEQSKVAASATRVSVFAVIVAAVIAVALFGWLLAR